MSSGLPADHTDGPLIGLTVQFELFSVLLTLAVHLDGLGGDGTGAQTVQVVELLHQVLHHVVLGERPLVEHLRRTIKQMRISV